MSLGCCRFYSIVRATVDVQDGYYTYLSLIIPLLLINCTLIAYEIEYQNALVFAKLSSVNRPPTNQQLRQYGSP